MRQSGGHEALPHTTLAAHHGQHAPDRAEPVGDAAPLGHDLVEEPRAVGFGQLVVGADVEGHGGKDALYDATSLRRTILLQRSVIASGKAIFSHPYSTISTRYCRTRSNSGTALYALLFERGVNEGVDLMHGSRN